MIHTYKLYERVRREFGTQADSQPFSDAFFSALLSISNDLDNKAFVEMVAPETMEANIDIDEKYYSAIYRGLKYYINNGPQWNVEQKGDLRAEYFMELHRAQSMYYADNAPSPYDLSD